jgi:hypothetical protein
MLGIRLRRAALVLQFHCSRGRVRILDLRTRRFGGFGTSSNTIQALHVAFFDSLSPLHAVEGDELHRLPDDGPAAA